MLMAHHNLLKLCKDIWNWFTSSPTQRSNALSSASSGRSPSPSVNLQEHPGSTRDSGAIQPKAIEQHLHMSAENSNVGFTTNPLELGTIAVASSQQPYTHQQPDADAETIGHKLQSNAHPFIKSPPRLFALIIGINQYESPNIPKLSGAVPDADAVRDFLRKHLGVPSSQIRNLRDSEATRVAIIDGIEAFSHNDEIKEGDAIFIYYAGHGGSADTPKGWEVGSTGKIELLIPYDHSSPLEDGNPKHGIPDRTLGVLLSQLAIEKGDNITVILDCCHSGSGTRNFKDPTEVVRGINTTGNIPSDLDRDVWTNFESLKVSERGTEVNAGFTRGGLRSHVLLAACGSEESAIEQKSRGVFTQKLLDALTTFEIDKLTYAGLLQRMPRLPSRQNPQCEGVNQNRVIFNAKAASKSTGSVYYKIRGKGEGYVMPDVGSARGISLGAEFEVYQDQDSGHILGTVVASEVKPFSTTLYAKESRFVLEGDGVALQTSAGTEEQVLRIHVVDEGLKALVMKIERTDPSHRIIQLVERDQAEFGMALEDGKVVFDIFDSLVTKHGLTRMHYSLEPTIEAICPVIRAADHFYWHLRRTPEVENDKEKGLANYVEIEMAEMEHDGVSYDDDLEPVLSPTSWKRGKNFEVQVNDRGTIYGWKIINKSIVALYPALFYFDVSDWSITSYYQPPTARGVVDPPLKSHRYLPVGYGDSGSVPQTFFLREGQDVDVGILKLFLSRKQVDLSDVAQISPFDSIGARSLPPVKAKEPIKTRFLWDTVLVPVVQRRAEK